MPATSAVATHRWNVCLSCPELTKPLHRCQKCGCVMAAKIWLKGAKCPLSKWDAEVSNEQWTTNNSLNDLQN